MVRHTNKRRNTRRRRQTRGKRRSQHGGSWFSTKKEDIDSNNKNIQEYKNKITELKGENQKLTSELNTPDEGFWSKLVGSKKNSSPEQEKVAYKEGEERESGANEERESGVPESVVVPEGANEGANEYNKSNNFSKNIQREPQYGPVKFKSGTEQYYGGSRRRRRHRSHRRHRRK
jgi:hypothetical protein